MKVLINILDLDMQGGVSNYYRVLKDKFSIQVDYFTIGARNWERSIYLKPFRLIKDYLEFIKKVKMIDYDLVVINPSLDFKSVFRDAMFCLLTKKYQKPFVIFFRGWDTTFERWVRKTCLSTFKSLFFSADAILNLGKEFTNTLREWGYTGPIFQESTIVDDALLTGFSQQNIYQKFKYQNKKFVILFLARIEKSKGIIEVIDTFQLLNQKYSNLELIIAGAGGHLKATQDYVTQNGVQKVIFTGFVTGVQKKKIFEQADLYLFPTMNGEGMPNSLLEALAFGLPVITTPVGGITDFFENSKMGFYIQEPNPVKMAALIEKLIENPELRLEMALYNHVFARQNFLASDVAKRLEKVFQEILSSNQNEQAA